jgi:1,4-dihydroxy-2-naphthoate polyprenyltransferase
VLLGAPAARGLFVGCVAGAFVAVAAVGVLYPPALIALAALPLAVQPVRLVMTRRDPPSLVAALVGTARLELVVAVLLALGLITA